MTNNQCICPHSPIYKTPQGCAKCREEQYQGLSLGQQLLNFDMAKVFEKLARLNLIEAFLEMDDETLQKIMLLL